MFGKKEKNMTTVRLLKSEGFYEFFQVFETHKKSVRIPQGKAYSYCCMINGDKKVYASKDQIEDYSNSFLVDEYFFEINKIYHLKRQDYISNKYKELLDIFFIVINKTDEEMEVELFSTELRAKKALKSMLVEV